MILSANSSAKDIEKKGTFSFLTYNVAGLPKLLAPVKDPAGRNKKIGKLVNKFDIVIFQEDFSYHKTLLSSKRHFFNSDHKRRKFIRLGDGLSRLSRFKIEQHKRYKWKKCYGVTRHSSDCLAKKGFSYARHVIRNQYHITVDIYNLHADAGDGRKDTRTRQKQFKQLLDIVQEKSSGRAVIIAGDFNIENKTDEKNYNHLLSTLGLKDVCSILSGKLFQKH